MTSGAGLLAFPAIAGVGDPLRYSYRQVHMGMIARVTLYARHETQARAAARATFSAIADVDQALSHFNKRSEALRLTARPGMWQVSSVLRDNLLLADEMHRISDGRFDASIGPLSQLWREARRRGVRPNEDALAVASDLVGWRDALSLEGDHVLVKRKGAGLDFGGSGKGYAVDKAATMLADHGVSAAMIELGGDIRLLGPPPGCKGWAIGFRAGGGRKIRTLADCAVSTSGPEFQSQSWEGRRYSHVIDTASGKALTNHRQLSVIGADGRECDAAATIIAMMEADEGREFVRRNFKGVQIHEV